MRLCRHTSAPCGRRRHRFVLGLSIMRESVGYITISSNFLISLHSKLIGSAKPYQLLVTHLFVQMLLNALPFFFRTYWLQFILVKYLLPNYISISFNIGMNVDAVIIARLFASRFKNNLAFAYSGITTVVKTRCNIFC